jgi:hypothetical protein
MHSLFKKVELVANVAIIAVAILLGAVLIKSFFSRSRVQPSAPIQAIQPGTHLSLPGVDWKANGRTLVLALSTQCHFCTDSAPFYRRIAEQRSKAGNLRLIAVLPQPVADSQRYLKELGLTVDDVKQLPLDSLGVIGTPTLIEANNEGVVAASWRGKLTSEKEGEVLNRLR